MGAPRRAALGLALGLLAGPLTAQAAPSPCPRLTPEAFAARLRAIRILPSHHFRFGDAHFYRASGRVDCRTVGEVPTCQFSGPVALQIATAGGRYLFFPGSGAATVTIRGGQPACVTP